MYRSSASFEEKAGDQRTEDTSADRACYANMDW